MDAHGFRFINDAMEAVNQIFMVVIALIDIKHGQNQLVLILDQLLKQLDVIRIPEMIPCQHIDLIHQVLLALRQRTLGSLHVGAESL